MPDTNKQTTGAIAEGMMVRELKRHGIRAVELPRNSPTIDIVAYDRATGKTVGIQVKGKRTPDWQFRAGWLLDIKQECKRQRLEGKKSLANKDLIYVLVNIPGKEFYYMTLGEFQDMQYKVYERDHIKPGKEGAGDYFTVSDDEVRKYGRKEGMGFIKKALGMQP